MIEERWMQEAIDAARRGMEAGQSPFGACVVKDGQVVCTAHNDVWRNTDPTAHAEVQVIRKACGILGTIDLTGCDIYSTCEPCPMCFTAIHWARFDRVIYGATIDDAAAAGFHELHVSNQQMKEIGRSEVEIVANFMRQPCAELFGQWLDRGDQKVY